MQIGLVLKPGPQEPWTPYRMAQAFVSAGIPKEAIAIYPGAGDIALFFCVVFLDVCFTQPGHEERLTIDDFRHCIDGKSSGAVRISVGMVTNFKDVRGFLAFARGLLT